MNVRRAIVGVALTVACIGAGCSLDFDRALPCDGDDQCQQGWSCDLALQRCVRGEVTPDGDVAVDVEDDGGRPGLDTDVPDGSGGASDAGVDVAVDVDAADVPDDVTDVGDATNDVGGDATDAATETGDDVIGDVCVSEPEICDEVDNDCNGLVDDGISCGGPCGSDAVEIAVGDLAVCVDLYEASRPDATESAEGTDGSRATSRRNVMPWSGATFSEAQAACEGSGRRLCTATEWNTACAGPEGLAYPYGARYDAESCNGLQLVPRDSAVPTGSLRDCRAATGTWDQSGNLAEWTSEARVRGGGFASVETNLKCTSVDGNVNPSLPEPSVGFRCCRDR